MNPKNHPLTPEEITEGANYIKAENMKDLSIFLTGRLNQRWIKLDPLCRAISKYVAAGCPDKAVKLWLTIAADYKPAPKTALFLIGAAVLWKLAVLAAVLGGVLYLARSCS